MILHQYCNSKPIVDFNIIEISLKLVFFFALTWAPPFKRTVGNWTLPMHVMNSWESHGGTECYYAALLGFYYVFFFLDSAAIQKHAVSPVRHLHTLLTRPQESLVNASIPYPIYWLRRDFITQQQSVICPSSITGTPL